MMREHLRSISFTRIDTPVLIMNVKGTKDNVRRVCFKERLKKIRTKAWNIRKAKF